METHDKSGGGLTLADAVEVLSSIADSHWEQEDDLYEILDQSHIQPKEFSWVAEHDPGELVLAVKEIFKVILRHIQSHYGSTYVTDSKALEGIKTIMVMVGEAAKKIDRYTDLFKARSALGIEGLKEYKQLQEFYRRKISRTIDEAMLGKWILALTTRTFLKQEPAEIKDFESKHVFVDMESVKNDTEYELFFIRKEDGSRFFSPRLIRNIKLVCDFGTYLGKEKEIDLWTDQRIWEDRLALGVAESIYNASKKVIDVNYPIIAHNKHHELPSLVNKAVIALLLASNKGRLIKNSFLKGCTEYLSNFQEFLREILLHRDYQHLVAFPSQAMSPANNAVRKIVGGILQGIFMHNTPSEQVQSYFQYLVKEGKELLSQEHKVHAEKSGMVWNNLACDYASLQKFFRHHPNGHLNKILDVLEDGEYQTFDPYIQGLFPEHLYSLIDREGKIDILSLPTPTEQAFIHDPKLIPELINFLRFHQEGDGNLLIFNLQDRTSWREHSRSHLVEEIQNGTEFENFLNVVTLPKDTEFYHQDPPYHEDHQWIAFKEHALQHVFDEHTGFYIPEKLKAKLSHVWMGELLDAIHRIFFSGKNVLSKEARLDFIEIMYAFLELKLIELSNAKTVYFCCKDGVDISPAHTAFLAAFLNVIHKNEPSKAEMERLSQILHAQAVLTRERVMLPDRFHRMINGLKVVENVSREHDLSLFNKIIHKAFALLYPTDILQAEPHFPKIM